VRLLLLLSLCAALAPAQAPRRPRITGVAHIAIYSKDVAASRAFYHDLLGYDEAFDLKDADGKLALTFFKINDRQFIELFPEREPASDRLNHIAFEVDDAEAMLAWLASNGLAVPAKVPKGRTGNLNFTIKDPDGHGVEFVQYLPGSESDKTRGRMMGPARISDRMPHVGILVGSLDKAMAFYRGILGFEETWRGSRDGKILNWVNMKVPDGDDYVEFMLYTTLPGPTQRGTAHHLCLFVPDIEKSKADLESRPARQAYTRPLEIRTGINRRRQMNLYDADGTRVELMEPQTVDGRPVPSSTVPPPGS
jgi:catechol 2,3-dioxygenase-like lactoylglutathione lyase family enzyme